FGGGGGPLSRATTPGDGGGGGGSSWAVPAAISTEFLGASRTGDGSVTITTLAGVAVSSTTVTASHTSIRAGDEVKYTATVSPGDAGGTLTFTADGADIPDCTDMYVSNGIAECWNSRVLRTVGTHTISARYSGSDGALPSTAPGLAMTVQVASTSTTLEADEVSVDAGTPVTYTATVTPPPVGGTVRFRSTGQAISGCDAVVPDPDTGVALCTFVYRTTGGWSVYADFSGTSSYSASGSSEVTQSVNPTPTTTVVTSGGNPSGIDQTVTYTASVSPPPTSGTVAFTHDGTAVAGCAAVAVNGSGQASCTRTYATGGSHTMSAAFAGVADYAASTSGAFTQAVSASIALSSDTGSAPLGFGVRVTAAISPAPAGNTVTFLDGGSPVAGCTRLPVDSGSGRATCLTGFATVGTHHLSVDHYNAGGVLLGRSDAFSQDVTLATASYTVTSADSTFVVPAHWSDIRIEAWAAAGTRAHREDTTSPGQGGRVIATAAVTPGQVLQVSVGALGGGGTGDTGDRTFGPGGSGGGASGVRFGPCAATLSCDVGSTLVVAGGGGGSGSWNGSYVGENSWIPCGGNGGINTDGSGGAGCSTDSNIATGGAGGTATAGGAGGTKTEFGGFTGNAGTAGHGGGGAVASPTTMGGGGGGDGYFGGGGGAGGAAYSLSRGGGGGGSSWVSPTVTSSAFLGSPSTGAGSVTITHAATRVLLTSASGGNLPYGVARTLTARLVDSGGATIDSGPDSTLPVTFSHTAGAGTVAGLTTVGAVAGVATIQVTGADLGALNVTAAAGGFVSEPWTLIVARVAQVLTFAAPPSPAVYGTAFLVAPTVDSGLATSLEVSGGCTGSAMAGGWTITMTSGSTACTLVASQEGDALRQAAPSVTRVVTAAKQAQTPLVLAATSTGTYGEAYPVVGSGGSGTGSLSLDLTGSACTLTDNTASSAVLTAVGIGTCTMTLTRAGDANHDAAQSTRSTAIGARPLTVTANAATKVYGTADPAVTATLSGFAFAET
ncbi:MAG: Ig-like domain repeat protein, partial [Cellulomonadaceae bacterium]|nr:Ig-like domain repeat protein [Cellulomonadaceae bacterium]